MTQVPDEEAVPPPDYTTIDRADVYKNGALAAHLERTAVGTVFSYAKNWIEESGAAVATTLPVTSAPVVTTGGAVPAFFAGLLPEGRRLGALRRSLKTSADDELSLVLAVGADAIGDVTVFPAGIPPVAAPARLSVEDFTSVEFDLLLADLNIHVDRVGIPGVQDKVSLAMLNLPVTRAGHRYLLKLNPPEFAHLVENEHFFLAAARTSGLGVAYADLVHDAVGQPGLVVRRFDRVADGRGDRSLAVEDGCQILGLHPEAKYRITTEDLLAKLCSMCDAPLPAARAFLGQIVFAYVTGNGGAHAKNFSILQDEHGRWAPTPAYDLPSSQPHGDNTLALSVAGKRDGNIAGSKFVQLGTSLGLPDRAAGRVVATFADEVDRGSRVSRRSRTTKDVSTSSAESSSAGGRCCATDFGSARSDAGRLTPTGHTPVWASSHQDQQRTSPGPRSGSGASRRPAPRAAPRSPSARRSWPG